MEKDIVISTVRIPTRLYITLKKIANDRQYSLNTIMKMAIECFLKLEEEKENRKE